MKRIAHIVCIVFLLLAGLVFSGCKDGVFEGMGGGGNLIILDRTTVSGTQLNGKWIEVEGVKGSLTVGFNPTNPRIQIKGRKLSAPLYKLNTTPPEKYIENDTFSFTVKVYTDKTTNITDPTLPPKSITVQISNQGSGVINWFD